MHTDPTPAVVRQAADWWVYQVEHGSSQLTDARSRRTFNSIIQLHRQNLTPQRIASFHHRLTERIELMLLKSPDYLAIRHDYQPDSLLADALQHAGINAGVLSGRLYCIISRGALTTSRQENL